VVESQPSKLLVAGSIPVSRSRLRRFVGVSLSDSDDGEPAAEIRAQFARELQAKMAFEQATIKVEKAQEFGELQAAVGQVFQDANVERFLKQMDRKSVRVRDFDGVLAKKVLEGVVSAKVDARKLYQALTLSDQAQMREFYLSKLETVEQSLRHKFKKLYQYY
jgi:hypothetical protein